MEEKYSFQQLLKKYSAQTCTPEEKALVDAWYVAQKKQNVRFDLTDEEVGADLEDSWQKISASIQTNDVSDPIRLESKAYKRWFSVAAVVITLLSGTWAMIRFQSNNPTEQVIVENQNPSTTEHKESKRAYSVKDAKVDFAPARQTAQLILSDGQRIQIGGHNKGSRVDHQIGIDFTKENIISYVEMQGNMPKELANLSNTIITPKGAVYTVVLADGTKVMLNADSKLTFPLQFAGNSREVYLEGEAYFDVTKQKIDHSSQPFIVHTAQSQIRVLGTRFNVNAYNDQTASSTTLEEGSVEVTRHASMEKHILIPGQQAYLTASNLQVREASLTKELAWKDGDFVFEGASIAEMMDELARWYDVDVKYLGEINNDKYISTISRSKSLKQVLEVLEATTNVRFDIQMQGKERRLMVIP
ncbi:FecR family protein [Sphingobacterium corticis]|uniref:FecR family protein n=1 Tax=Sphingobacterium corticis TaxID=1812823 RepID=A0ABW5NJD7_9SPHI